MKIIFFLAFTLIYSACSPKPGTTAAKISLGAQSTSELFPGGLYIILHKKNADANQELGEFRRIVDTDLEIELENGIWEFGAIGWEGEENMQGKPKCFMSDPIILEGQDVSVNLNTSYEGCSKDPFVSNGLHDSDGAPLETQIISCAGLDTLNKTKNEINPSSEYCGGNTGLYQSFKIVMYDMKLGLVGSLADRRSNAFESSCLSGGGFNYTNTNNLMYSLFYEGIPQFIKAYESSDCTGSPDELVFLQGLREVDITDETPGFVVSDGSINKIYINNVLCSDDKITANTPQGLGSESAPFIVCGINQLKRLDTNPGANWILARNLEQGQLHDSYSNISTSNPFQGNFDGKGHYIKNLKTPLFNWVTGTAKIKNIILQDVNITSSEDYVGALAARVFNATTYLNIENITVDNFSINFSSSTTNTYVGGLIGKIDNSGTNYINISDIIISNGSVNLDGSNVSYSYLGGISGYTYADTKNTNHFRNLKVENTYINNTHVTTSSSRTGGLFGFANTNNISFSTVTDSTIEGFQYVGGLIGQGEVLNLNAVAFTTNDFGNIQSKLVCNKPSDDIVNTTSGHNSLLSGNTVCCRFGGIIGNSSSGDTVLHNSMAIFKIEESDKTISYLGGLIGYLGTTGGSPSFISNNGVYLKTVTNGWMHGGLIGYSADSASSEISKNIVMGQITAKDTAQGTSANIGGLVGKNFGSALFNMNTVNHMYLSGLYHIGLAAGHNNSSISEFSAIDSTIFSDTNAAGNSNRVGGLTGYNDTSGVISNSLLYNTTIYTNKSTCSQGTTAGCGLLAGTNQNSAAKAFDLIRIENSDILNDTSVSIAKEIGGSSYDSINYTSLLNSMTYGSDTNYGVIVNENSLASTLGEPWSNNTNLGYIPTYLHKHISINGIDPTNNTLRFGNIFSPLLITSAEEWNMIQDDAYLLGKTFALTNDIDFDGKDFFPIGTYYNPSSGKINCALKEFTGSLLASKIDEEKSYALQNIDIDGSDYDLSSCGNSSLGIISVLGDTAGNFTSVVGMSSNPLLVTDFKLNNSALQFQSIGTIAGTSNKAIISAHILNADIKDTSSYYVGGLVGQNLNSHIFWNNIFTGSLEASGTNVAGLIGRTHYSSAGMSSIRYNYIKPTKLQNNMSSTYLGGLLGHYSNSAGLFGMKDNIIDLSEATFKTSSGQAGGFLGNLVGSNETIENNLVYIGNSQLTDGHSTARTFAINASGTGVDNYIIGYTDDGSACVATENFYTSEENFLKEHSFDSFKMP